MDRFSTGLISQGVDVGTGSVRAALVTDSGEIKKVKVEETKTWNDQPDFYEQSFDNIWGAAINCVKDVIQGINPEEIKGIGFDATCSLVCFDKEGKPLTISPGGSNERNIILWLDHRAVKEADEINKTNHEVLRYVGGKISPEMETPKLLWLKRNMKKTWDEAGYFFDLPDALTWRATNVDCRSKCSLVCKWTYEMTEEGDEGWNLSYFQEIGMEDLSANCWRKIGNCIQAPCEPVGYGLCERAAGELGLKKGTPVGTSMIDAHAGGLGLIGTKADGIDPAFHTRLSLICGTSTCHMAVSPTAIFVPGVWGPYKDAMIPGMWLSEGGQSATGKLIDFIIETHPATPEIMKKKGNEPIMIYLNKILEDMAKKNNLPSVSLLTHDVHVWPDFHGNRSPIADPLLKGMVSGLTLAGDEESLALLYLATIQSLAYGTRHIIDALRKAGYKELKSLLLCGGLSKNPIFTQTHAEVCNLPLVCPEEPESVLLGAAILGACASGTFGSMKETIAAMGSNGIVVNPTSDRNIVDFHTKKYQVFHMMYKHQMEYRNTMRGSQCDPRCAGSS
ncbi:unnamed protein product [Phyllotreta striolata]|uniref:FGGY carbohydrate kinase domain-containing protein n=1 Tax=Phyllotreta striolata TaxID=444603 RepID=A0A9N9TNB5_PHYSR|nr:unnamed protein product [Phyllotreta striolata]